MKYIDFNNLATPKVSTKFGAPMGRCNVNTLQKQTVNGNEFFKMPKTSKRRIYLDSQGYDKGGAYWGLGSPLYVEYSKDGKYIQYLR